MDYAVIGEKIRLNRLILGLTQASLAERAGISTAFVGHIERGTRVMFVKTLYVLCKALEVSADELIGL